ncbi:MULTISPECIES: hypothetical protein [Rhodococcus]|jgi:hypothetical protein|uniref:Uncharacterized protein n=1 Tax=Rhodococcus rhodochrous TaxID=1829 RepID=A0AA47AE41_RHORH|nr:MULTISPECIES: hypothetical protein [Rhodococcus]AYA23829.1 hypothetical protein C6369_004425 [Rhodococcus rhodochrous]MDC3729303.1 hypothetical protein [Rhodococcus sp. Rp3]MDO1486711.1 hypothetical protein [Rhodococcus rhodochrous]NMD93902.1 hypothetical protein [Rhodococcus sp. BL-253-APC-6A1W]TWH41251.1 hypothetical protein L612_005400000040 [Rhodococcus rhodochrous J38]
MAQPIYDEAALHLTFSRWEAPVVRYSAMAVPLNSISSVEVLPRWTSETLGIRSGLTVSGYLKVGTFLHPRGTTRLVSMKRGHPILRVGLRGRKADEKFDELLLSSPDAYEIAEALRLAGVR